MTDFYYSEANCGGGKTHWALHEMATKPGRYLFALDRREMIDGLRPDGTRSGKDGKFMGRVAELRQIARDARCDLRIEMVRSKRQKDDPFGTAKVRAEVEFAGERFSGEQHIVVICTHEALKGADLGRYEGWTCIIDETPSVLESRLEHSPASSAVFVENYSLKPVGGTRWSVVRPKERSLTMARLRNDDRLHDLQGFHRRAEERGVLVDLADWREMDTLGRGWTWWSLWLPTELRAFDRVIVLANAFTEMLTFKLWQYFDNSKQPITWKPISIGSDRQFRQRKLTIRYFAQAHIAGGYWFTTERGRMALEQVAHWLAQHGPRQQIWTANRKTAPIFVAAGVPGERLTPQQAGTNEFEDFDAATIIYASKPDRQELRLLKEWGIDPEIVRRSRELETIYQFACRTSLRLPDSERPVELYVYDEEQARFLAACFARSPHLEIQLELLEEAGIADWLSPRCGRGEGYLTTIERDAAPSKPNKAEKMAARRRAEREAKQRDGTYRGPGRPKTRVTTKPDTTALLDDGRHSS